MFALSFDDGPDDIEEDEPLDEPIDHEVNYLVHTGIQTLTWDISALCFHNLV